VHGYAAATGWAAALLVTVAVACAYLIRPSATEG
jgi:hypothetical protein